MHHDIENPYRPIETEVIEVITETPNIKTLRLRPKERISFVAGQFIELTVPGVGEAPFTPSSRPAEKDIMEVTIMKVGKVTERIHQLNKGDIVGLRGPLGKGYPIDSFKGKEILVVGGGCGLAPLRSLMYELFDRITDFKRVYYRAGCKTAKDFLYKEEIGGWAKRPDLDLRLTVDEGGSGWQENVGVVTTIMDGIQMDYASGIAVVCGPPIAMKFATKKLLELGFKDENIYLSMEKNMSCGIGKCGHCRIGTYYACKDGPVFTYAQIKNFPNIWD
ncbi:MAG: FAD/NAD(P)-binding protein [Candidatus Omnitrophica bacterium]|nr:FAD/NAD(P)-binding protein [Candidatus Omnitrophota bacterium]